MSNLILIKTEIFIKAAEALLQIRLLIRIGNKYLFIVSIIKIKWKMDIINIIKNIKKLVWFIKIKNKND